MRKQHTGKKPITVSLLSGKGGVGKTSICLVMGSILSHIGKKVLLVDCDIATHGMTYFFLDKLPKGKAGIVELLRNPRLKPGIFHNSPKCHILPSTTQLKPPNVPDIESNFSKYFEKVKNTLAGLSGAYEYILIDCPAGATEIVRSAIKMADKVLIVAEADPVSVWAIKNIEYDFGKILPHETFGIINKLFLEEKERYKAIVEYSRLMKFLPPLPFDMEVRRKFAMRQIPADLNNPTEFHIGLCYALRDLLPESGKEINSYLKQSRVQKTKDLDKEITEVDHEIRSLRDRSLELQFQKKFREELAKRVYITAFGILGMVILTFSLFKDMLNIYFPTKWFGAIAGMIIAGVAQLYLFEYMRRMKREKIVAHEELLFQTKLDDLVEKKKRLEVLLLDRQRPFL